MNKKIKIWPLFLLSLILAPSLKAQQIMKVEDAIAIGLKNNYDVLMARNQASISANDYRYADFAFLPTLNGNAVKSWATNDINQKL
ncbi:MAG: TolC family protein, partial [Chitinophagaceae bacterium]